MAIFSLILPEKGDLVHLTLTSGSKITIKCEDRALTITPIRDITIKWLDYDNLAILKLMNSIESFENNTADALDFSSSLREFYQAEQTTLNTPNTRDLSAWDVSWLFSVFGNQVNFNKIVEAFDTHERHVIKNYVNKNFLKIHGISKESKGDLAKIDDNAFNNILSFLTSSDIVLKEDQVEQKSYPNPEDNSQTVTGDISSSDNDY